MTWHRVYGVVLRYFYLVRRSLDRSSEVFIHPILDLAIWGLTGVYFQSLFSEGGGTPVFVVALVSGIIFWNVIWRAQSEVPFGILEDLWNRNLLNMFIAPLKISEWMLGLIILGFVKVFLTLVTAGLFALALYQVNLFMFGFHLIPFIFLLVISGWWIGFLITGLVLRLGTGFQALAWTLAFVIAPFSAVYYPVSVLPAWAQSVAWALPTTYIFEGMREVINTGNLNYSLMWGSLLLNVVYVAVTFLYLYRSFKKRLDRGLLTLD